MAARQEGEPSVEEILDSIKKVIARDNRAIAAEERSKRASAGVFQSSDDDAESDDDILDLAMTVQLDEAAESYEDAEFENDDAMGLDSDEPLVTSRASESMRDSLAALAMLSEPGAQPQIVRSGETSLEELTRELLRPALAEWLDKNLPPMVEKMVAAEIARIAGKRG